MYRLPENFDGTFLVGRILEQVCFNQNQACFHFDNGVSIIVESAFAHQHLPSEKDSRIVKIPVFTSDLMQLLGIPVASAQGDKNGTLSLLFENGHILKCFDTSAQFESYQIKHGETVIVV